MRLTRIYKDFFESEKASGLVLLCCTIFSLVITNTSFQNFYLSLWQFNVAGQTITHWVNEGLMTIFFLLIGLELEREIYFGELSKLRNAALPFVGALGGMIVPAAIFLFFNYGQATKSGAGIPMATDIAFSLAILSLLGKKVPASLKIFLTALAVIDDLGAIIIIAIFYTSSLAWSYLLIVAIIWAFLFLLNRLKVNNLIPYLVAGICMWYCMLHTGIHASITGIILAFVIPFGNGSSSSSSYKLQQFLHKPVAVFILPLFALVNTAIVINTNSSSIFKDNYSIGIMLGLFVGKALGIFTFCMLAIKLGIAKLPSNLKHIHFMGAGFLGGIGFTMSVFIAMLAFKDEVIINNSKLAIIIASFCAGFVGFIILKFTLVKNIVVFRRTQRKKLFKCT
jgi:Na+:H+ antiporter, NhaA family